MSNADFVFLNIPLKGYNKDEDVRYALNENEFWIEIKDGKVVRRLC